MKKRFSIMLCFFITTTSYAQTGPWDDKVVIINTNILIGDNGSNGACYSWKASPDDPSIINLKSAQITVRPAQTTTYTRTTVGQDFASSSTNQVKVWVLTGLTLTLLQPSVCDGEESGIQVNPVPSGIPTAALVASVTRVDFTSSTVQTSSGNPAGTTTLNFDPLSATATSKIQRGLWYSTQANNCNDAADYEIKATATLNGSSINSTSNPTFTVRATLGPGNCLDGSSGPTQFFSGSPQVNTTQQPNGSFSGVVAGGTFRRNVQASVNYTAPANSQYHNMVRDEEVYHKGQLEGTNSNIVSDLWLAQNVLNATNAGGPFTGATQAAVTAAASSAFSTALTNEITRSNNIAFPYPGARRCALEKEAKLAVGSSYKVALRCTYTACPN